MRLMIAMWLASGVALAQLDQYGGSTLLKCSGGARAHFYTERIGNQWWLCTPEGNAFWYASVYNVGPDNSMDFRGINTYQFVDSKYVTGITTSGRLNWCQQMVRRLKQWGFNTLDMYAFAYLMPHKTDVRWPTPDRTIPEKMASIRSDNPTRYSMYNLYGYAAQPMKNLTYGIKSTVYTKWRGTMGDYFDGYFPVWLEKMLVNSSPGLNSDWVIGVVLDDGDYLYWANAGPDFPTSSPSQTGAVHAGWVVLVTSPVQTAADMTQSTPYLPVKVLYPDTQVYTKTALATFLAQKYGTVEALNTAWEASYTTFVSSGQAISGERIGTGDGATATISGTLAEDNPSPWSVQVLVNGTAAAGDDGRGRLVGPEVSGLIDYSGRTVELTFASPPAEGAAITVNYVACGFGCGTGLLDEDGTHGWVPQIDNQIRMSGGNAAIKADLDEFLRVYATQYFSTVKSGLQTYWGDYLYLGPTSLGGWAAPARAQVYQAAAQYVDVIRVPNFASTSPDYQDRIDFIAAHGGDKPWTFSIMAPVAPDGYFSDDPRGGTCAVGQYSTQEARGAAYIEWVRGMLSARSGGVRHAVGLQWWELLDNRKECSNFGLMTRRDNPYDGVSARKEAGIDEWGYPTGGEAEDYGDFISSVKLANRLWLPKINEQLSGQVGVVGRDVVQ